MTAREIAARVFGHAVQDPEELTALLEEVKALRPLRVLEIGVYRGGTLLAFALATRVDATILGVDDFSQKVRPLALRNPFEVIEGDSRDPEVLEQVKMRLKGPVDFLFIDGAHDYQTVTNDVNMYVPLVRPGGMVAMHDVSGNPEVGMVFAGFYGFPGRKIIYNRYSDPQMGIGVFRIPEVK